MCVFLFIMNEILTRALLRNPKRLPPERTVDTIMIGFSWPWNTSAVPIVMPSKSKRWQANAIFLRCILYGVTTPMSVCDIFMKWLYDGANRFLMHSITAITSMILNKLKIMTNVYRFINMNENSCLPLVNLRSFNIVRLHGFKDHREFFGWQKWWIYEPIGNICGKLNQVSVSLYSFKIIQINWKVYLRMRRQSTNFRRIIHWAISK